MHKDDVVAVGLLTARDLQLLGADFTRHFPVPEGEAFDDLLRQLDQIDFQPSAPSQRHPRPTDRPAAAES